MIVIDTSAVIAVLENEDDADFYIQQLEEAIAPVMSSATYVELCAVMSHKRGDKSLVIVDRFIKDAEISIESFTQEQAKLARDAYIKYKILNLGDSYSYALAKSTGMPLLFKGNDFSQTDLKLV